MDTVPHHHSVTAWDEIWFRVDPHSQTVAVCAAETVFWQAQVSTARLGLGEVPDSRCTPRGLHTIGQKIGDGAVWGTVFKGRKPTGAIWKPPEQPEADLILTRILWLEGMEARNATTRNRYIYFHGTNDEAHIGQAASAGCIRLRNDDMIALYEWAEVGTRVLILD